MQDVVLAALLVIDDELHGDTSALRPVGERRGSPVANHVARISSGVRHPAASPHSPECVSSQRYDRMEVCSSLRRMTQPAERSINSKPSFRAASASRSSGGTPSN